jgi:hypothetical protein
MLREMTGEEMQDWRAKFALEADEERDRALDQKGKAALRKLG